MPDQEPALKPVPVHKYLLSALPGFCATLFVLLHLRAPVVSPHFQSILMNAWLGLVCATLAYWLYLALCRVADRICTRFDARHAEIARLMQAHTDASARDFRAAMVKLSKACKRLDAVERHNTEIERQNQEMTQEIAHLRELIVDSGVPATGVGPTPYS